MFERQVNPGEVLGGLVATTDVAVGTPAQQLAAAVQQNAGVANLSNGTVFNLFTIPTSFSWTVSSTDAGAATTVYGFNNNVLNAAVTNNGGGAGTIVNTYGDGFTGKVYENYARSANGGMGVKILAMTIESTNYTSGAQTTPFSTLAFNIIAANGQGSVIPIPVNLQEAVRNTQYQSGILTVKKPFYLNALTQLSLLMPINTKLVITLFTEASGFNG